MLLRLVRLGFNSPIVGEGEVVSSDINPVVPMCVCVCFSSAPCTVVDRLCTTLEIGGCIFRLVLLNLESLSNRVPHLSLLLLLYLLPLHLLLLLLLLLRAVRQRKVSTAFSAPADQENLCVYSFLLENISSKYSISCVSSSLRHQGMLPFCLLSSMLTFLKMKYRPPN